MSFYDFFVGNGMLVTIEMHRTSVYVEETIKEEEEWSLVENIKANAARRIFLVTGASLV